MAVSKRLLDLDVIVSGIELIGWSNSRSAWSCIPAYTIDFVPY